MFCNAFVSVCVCPEDSVAFWHGVKEAGLLEDVVEDFQRELEEVLKGLQERVSETPLQVKGQNYIDRAGSLYVCKKLLRVKIQS